MVTISQRGAEAYVFWLDQAEECLIEATNALGWLGPGEMDFDDALIRVLNQVIEKHGVRVAYVSDHSNVVQLETREP